MAAACVQALPHNSPLRKSTPGPHLHFIGKFYKYSYEAFREYVEYPSYLSSISPKKIIINLLILLHLRHFSDTFRDNSSKKKLKNTTVKYIVYKRTKDIEERYTEAKRILFGR